LREGGVGGRPRLLRVRIENGGRFCTMNTAVSGAAGFWSRYLISVLMSAKPMSKAPDATRRIASSGPAPGSTVT
jgi:hypothetical protein